MKIKSAAFIFTFCLMAVAFFAQPATAELGNGSTDHDTLQVGKITSLGDRQLSVTTEFEQNAKKYSFTLHRDAYVNVHEGGAFKKFAELKVGDLVAVYGWNIDGKYVARRIMTLDANHYLLKRLAQDAKDKVYYKHER